MIKIVVPEVLSDTEAQAIAEKKGISTLITVSYQDGKTILTGF